MLDASFSPSANITNYLVDYRGEQRSASVNRLGARPMRKLGAHLEGRVVDLDAIDLWTVVSYFFWNKHAGRDRCVNTGGIAETRATTCLAFAPDGDRIQTVVTPTSGPVVTTCMLRSAEIDASGTCIKGIEPGRAHRKQWLYAVFGQRRLEPRSLSNSCVSALARRRFSAPAVVRRFHPVPVRAAIFSARLPADRRPRRRAWSRGGIRRG